MQFGPRLIACVFEITSHVPSTGKGIRPCSRLAAPLALRRLRRVVSDVIKGETADIVEEIAEDLSMAAMDQLIDMICISTAVYALLVMLSMLFSRRT